ncbi:MAG: DUF433 domain-containing protein [Candidatus Riflebacteria bacterium]|nr:DUF433 domain-containing protein [Candidatus Riflebacteria bacterium]
MTRDELLARVVVNPAICGGRPCVRGTRIYIAIILASLAEGASPEELLKQYPSLVMEDVRAALAYAADLAQENTWKLRAE